MPNYGQAEAMAMAASAAEHSGRALRYAEIAIPEDGFGVVGLGG